MVRKFIQSILKKGNQKPEEADVSGDVPKEIPLLAEDIMESAGADKQREQAVTAKISPEKDEKKECSLEIRDFRDLDAPADAKENANDADHKDDAQHSSMDLSQDVFLQNDVNPQAAIANDFGMLAKIQPSETEKAPGNGFFAELLSIMEGRGIKEKVLKQDLYKKMCDFWYYHPSGEGRLANRERLKQNVHERIRQLKVLEERWVMQRKFMEEDRCILAEKGREIRSKIEQLQLTLGQLKLHEDVPSDKQFHLRDNVSVKNVVELMQAMEVIDDAMYSYHVTSDRNDFATWISLVIEDKLLAKKVCRARTRHELALLLENELSGNSDQTDPDHYFRFKGGRVARNISDLFIALNEISNEEFDYHRQRNDFCLWIRHVLGNDSLAEKVKSALTREGMIAILRTF